jgi:predicted DNA-binding protein
MTNGEMLVLRIPLRLKTRLRTAAQRQKKSVTAYVKEGIEAQLRNGDTQPHRPARAAREALARYIGGTRSRKKTKLTNEEIDRIVYGDL